MLDMIPVAGSSDIAGVGYDTASHTLYVRFLKGGTYSYFNVPEIIYRNLMNAPSKGKYFAANIRKSYVCRPMH